MDRIIVSVSTEVMVIHCCLHNLKERLGLIKARFTGGEEASQDFLAFIDAHVFVGPNWLTTPHRLLSEVFVSPSYHLGS